MVDLVGELRVFLAVAEEEHVTRGADRLGLAQPAVSRRLKALERALGAQLFARTGRRVVITDHGRRLVPLARDLIDQADRILELGARTGAVPGVPVRLALPIAGEVAPLAAAIRLAAEHGVVLTLMEGAETERRRRVADRQVDLALVRVQPEQAAFRVPLGFGSAGESGRWAESPDRNEAVRPLHLDALRGRTGRRAGPAVLVQTEDSHAQFLDGLVRAAGRAGMTADQIQPVPAETSAPARVLAGEGLMLCSRPEASRAGLHWRPSGDGLARDYALTGTMPAGADLPDEWGRLLRRAFGGRSAHGVCTAADPGRSIPTALFG